MRRVPPPKGQRAPAQRPFTPADLGALVADLGAAFADLDAIVADMLRPARRRELGPVLHRRHFREARSKVAALLAWAGGDGEQGGC